MDNPQAVSLPRFDEQASQGRRIGPVDDVSTVVLDKNGGRLEAFIQNIGTSKVYVRLGAGAGNTDGTYDMILAPGDFAEDGKGDKAFLDWKGIISIYGEEAEVVVSERF